MTEESYGPIAAVRKVRDEGEALALSNALPFGLAAYVYSQDLERAWGFAEKLERARLASTSTIRASCKRLLAVGSFQG
jgi:acyl-CoA reductase-like NAD-dependent aldehyde dehydrogenase